MQLYHTIKQPQSYLTNFCIAGIAKKMMKKCITEEGEHWARKLVYDFELLDDRDSACTGGNFLKSNHPLMLMVEVSKTFEICQLSITH